MTPSQKKAMIEFHRKMEKAFREHGKVKEAEQAKQKRLELEKQ